MLHASARDAMVKDRLRSVHMRTVRSNRLTLCTVCIVQARYIRRMRTESNSQIYTTFCARQTCTVFCTSRSVNHVMNKLKRSIGESETREMILELSITTMTFYL